MNYKLKRLVLLLASVATVATIGASLDPVTYTVSAATHHKNKHHKKIKKHHVAKKNNASTTSNSDKAYKAYRTQLNNDINSYNDIVGGFATYTLASGGNDNAYQVDANNGNNSYSNGNYTDMSNSLNDIVKDMNTNNDYYDLSDNGFENHGIQELQEDADHLYLLFRDRFSSDENNTLEQLRDTIDKNQIQNDSNSTYVSGQWTNLKNFFTELSKALPTLNKY
ncbi:hypothetical protein ACYATP_00025 [Lactobacillaceae bacterium Melli_B4]